MSIAPSQDAISGVSTTPLDLDYIYPKNEVCMWCDKVFSGEFIFCDECMKDESTFQARWDIASDYNGTLTDAPHDDIYDDPECEDCGHFMSYHASWCPHNHA